MESTGKPRDTPNVLVIFCDQLRRDLLGCYGGALVRAPHIDALAADAVVFDRCYTPTAICSPARASLMTGLYPHGHHMFNNSTVPYSYCEHLPPGVAMLPDWIADETDYESAYFGKWHIGPADDLFNSRFHHTHKPYPGGPSFLADTQWHPSPKLGPLVESVAGGKAGTLDVPMDRFPDVVAAQYTRDFLTQRDRERPFTLFCAFPGPHSPWMIPADFGLRYDARDIPIWRNRHDDFIGKPLYQQKLRLLGDLRQNHDSADTDLQDLLAYCFSYLELIDGLLGDVIATLKELDLYDTTAIFFTADHGDMAGSHGFLSKGGYMYDEIYRIPLLFKPAGAAPKIKRAAHPVHLMDVTATLMHLMAGQPQTTMGGRELHGQSLLPLLEVDAIWYKPVHYAEFHGDWYGHYTSRMVTDGDWKLVWNLGDLCELYDLNNDPAELTNRFYDPTCGSERDRYLSILFDEAKRFGDGQLDLWHPSVEGRLAVEMPPVRGAEPA